MKIAYEWYDTNDPILGIKNYIPICELEIRKKDKTWVRFVFTVDSGADTILMKESDCRDLGFSLENCQQLEFHRASDKTIKTRVRMLDMRIAGYMIKNIPIAFHSYSYTIIRKSKNIWDIGYLFLYEQKNTIFAS